MTPGAFDAAFTAFVRGRGLWRDDTAGAVLERWSSFVEECEHGYRERRVRLRQRGDVAHHPRGRDPRAVPGRVPRDGRLRRRVAEIDARFRPLLVEHAHRGIDVDEWWLRGVVRYAGHRLAREWKQSFGFDIEVVRQSRA